MKTTRLLTRDIPRLSLPLALLGCLTLSSTPTHAAAALPSQGSDRQIRDELELARGLAKDWQFVELAETVIDGIKLKDASDSIKEEIGLARCEIFATGAKRERDEERKLELYDKALQSYTDYLDEFRFAKNRGQAERDLVDLSRAFGIEVFALREDAVGERADELRTLIQDVLTDAIGRTSDLTIRLDAEIDEQRELELATSSLEHEKFQLLLNRSEMLLTIARVSDDGTYYFEQSIATSEQIADQAGSNGSWERQAYLLSGRIFIEMGDYTRATDYLEYVFDNCIPLDPEVRSEAQGDGVAFDDLARGTKDALWYFVDAGTAPIIDAFLASGRVEEACLYALHFENCKSLYGFDVSRPRGYESQLSAGRALMNSGGYVGGDVGEYLWFQTREDMRDAGFKNQRNSRSGIDLALQLAQNVNRDNRGNSLQLLAQGLIAEIIDRGVAVDPEILFEAAQGAFYQQRYSEAIEGFKRVLAVLEVGDQATRTRVGPEVIWHIGRSFQKSNRDLEAAMAFRMGLDDRWVGDPKYDLQNAKQFHSSIKTVKRAAGEDLLLETLFRESQDLVVKYAKGAGASNILYSQAENAYQAKDYEDARTRFLQVPGNADEYEKALAFAAVCLNKLDQPDQALTELEDYLQNYVTDPVRTPTTDSGKKRRSEAMGLARYYGGLIHYNAAETGSGSYEKSLEWFDTYVDDFPDQLAFGPKTIYFSLSSFLKLGKLDQAEARRDRLVKDFREDRWTGIGAYEIYKVNRDLRKEAEKAKETENLPKLTRAMAVNLGLYNELAGEAKLNNLRIESRLWTELEEWETVKRLLTGTLSRFGSDESAEVQKTLTTSVKPELAHALLELKEVRDAAKLLTELMADPAKPPGSKTQRNYSRAISGWIEGDESEIIEIPGVGGEEAFTAAAAILIKLAKRAESFDSDWYTLKFELAYTYYQWSQIDGKKLQSAKNVVGTLKSDLSTGLPEITETCGNDILRQRFLWLDKKL